MKLNQNILIDQLLNFYSTLDKVFDEVNKNYPEIQCKTGCNRCCKFYGSPEIYQLEWHNIQKHIENKFSDKEIKRVERKFLQGLSNDLNNNHEESVTECPFIYKNMCSIYEKRPFICRIFGLSKFENKLMTCSEELNRWENKGSKLIPDKEYLEIELLNFLQSENKEIKSINQWLNNYFKNKKDLL